MTALRYIDVCSGISAPTAAWHPLGWQALCYAEIEKAPRAVLAHHYPDVPLCGDFTQIKGTEYGAVDLLVGGTPCQSFSIAGLRGGLDDSRGNLALEYLRLADRARPRWLVWENVPGVLSSNAGRDFGAILGGMGELGYGFAYRVLDAQHFGVPQRRRRVFVVGYLGDWRRAAAVLFERHSLQGHPAPRREERQAVAALTANGVGTCGADDNQGQAGHLLHCEPISRSLTACNTATGRLDPNEMEFIAHTLTSNGDAHSGYRDEKGLIPVTPIDMRQASRGATMTNNRAAGSSGGAPGTGIGEAGDPSPTISTSHVPAIAFGIDDDVAHCLRSGASKADKPTSTTYVGTTSAVRRLTPRECERLQGFPDDFTLVPFRGRMMADGPRYKMLGNSMAVPVVRWIGERIEMVDAISFEKELAA